MEVVSSTSTGRAVLDEMGRHRPHALLLDLLLPDVPDPGTLVRELRERSPDTAILLISNMPASNLSRRPRASAWTAGCSRPRSPSSCARPCAGRSTRAPEGRQSSRGAGGRRSASARRPWRRRGAGRSGSPRPRARRRRARGAARSTVARSSSGTRSRGISSRIRWRGRSAAAAMRTKTSRPSLPTPSAARTTDSLACSRLATAASRSCAARCSTSSSARGRRGAPGPCPSRTPRPCPRPRARGSGRAPRPRRRRRRPGCRASSATGRRAGGCASGPRCRAGAAGGSRAAGRRSTPRARRRRSSRCGGPRVFPCPPSCPMAPSCLRAGASGGRERDRPRVHVGRSRGAPLTALPGGGPPSSSRPRTAGSRSCTSAVVDDDRVEALALAAREQHRLDEVDDPALDRPARGGRRRSSPSGSAASPARTQSGTGRPAQAARQHSET